MEQRTSGARRPLAAGIGHKCSSCAGTGEQDLHGGTCFPCNGTGRVRSWTFVGQEAADRVIERIVRGVA